MPKSSQIPRFTNDQSQSHIEIFNKTKKGKKGNIVTIVGNPEKLV